MENNDTLTMLEIKRTIGAEKQRVFDALTQPDIMAKWFFGMEGGSAKVESDFRVGGKYAIYMYDAEGKEEGCAKHEPHGEYLEIDEPDRLAFTWISEGFVDYSVVTIELREAGEATELILKHELPEAVVEPHTQGWNACLGNLASVFG